MEPLAQRLRPRTLDEKGKMPKLLDVVRGFSKRGIDLRFDRSPIL